MSNKILKEAIAEAKTIKETAIANAKAALEEAFEPRLRSMLAKRLEEMETEDDDLDEAYGLHNPDTGEVEQELPDEIEIDEEMDLESILAELELEDDDEEPLMEAEESEDEEIEDEEEEVDLEDTENEEIDLDNLTEDDLKSFIENVISDMVASGDLEPGEGSEDMGDMEDEDIDLDSIEDDEEFVSEEEKEPEEDENELKEVRRNLNETLKTVKFLKNELNDVNLLNSKLLYLNKIFKGKTLNEAQKNKMVNIFDKVKTTKEAKLIFETLNESIKTENKKPIREHLSRASKPIGGSRKPIIEVDSQVARWQKLAGLE